MNEAAVSGKVDTLEGLKENVIVGHHIPAGTGLPEYETILVGSKSEYESISKNSNELNKTDLKQEILEEEKPLEKENI